MSQQGVERAWWWKVAMHLDEAQLATINVLPHNAEDPTPVYVLQGKLREVQAFLLEIFRWKGIAPSASGTLGAHPPNMEGAHPPNMEGAQMDKVSPPNLVVTSQIAEDGWILNDVTLRAKGQTAANVVPESFAVPTEGTAVCHSSIVAEEDILPPEGSGVG
jgi:hypothetical protein